MTTVTMSVGQKIAAFFFFRNNTLFLLPNVMTASRGGVSESVWGSAAQQLGAKQVARC